jgi:hypothetical protein
LSYLRVVVPDDGLEGGREARYESAPRPREKGMEVKETYLETKDMLRDGSDSVIDVSKGRSPPRGDSATVAVSEDLDRPSELGDDVLVREPGHVRVRPAV